MRYLIAEGINAINLLNNIQLPTTEEQWLTSMLGFEQMYGLPNVVACLDVTPIYGVAKTPEFKCPVTGRLCLKVAMLRDSSGKILDFKIFNGRLTEPDYLEQWPFYARLKATEKAIGLPGIRTVYNGEAPTLEEYPGRPYLPRDSNGKKSKCETTAAGILVDGHYSSESCALFIAPNGTDKRLSSIFSQRLFRTKFHAQQTFGTLSQFVHLEQQQ